MTYLPLIIAACCLVYGLYRVIFQRVTDEEAAEIAEEHWKQYARVTGIALLIEAIVLVLFYHWSENGILEFLVRQPILLTFFVIFAFSYVVVVYVSKKVYKRK